MRVRIHRHIADLAGSGLVLIGFLLAAMALSAVPLLLQGLNRHPPPAATAGGEPGGHGPGLSGTGRPIS
jgi:hypothetical protein